MKRVLSVLLVMILALGVFAGCGDDSAPADGGSTAGDGGTATDGGGDGGSDGGATASGSGHKIGYNYYTGASYALTALRDNSGYVVSAFGGESVTIDDEASIEKIVQDVENMISSGCDGLLIWLPAETMYPTIAEICETNQVPFVLNDKVPEDPDIVAQLKANPYCVGAIGPANAVYGSAIAEYALAQGYTNCIIASGEVGDPTDTPRLAAFREVFEAGGGEILEQLHSNSTETQGMLENALIVNPNPDFIYGTGSDFGNAACDALDNKGFDTVVMSSGLDSTSLDRLADENNPMVMVNGDFWICGTLAAIIMQNYLDGTPLVDANGDAVWYTDVQPFEVPAEQYELYKKFFLDEFCYTAEELREFSGEGFGYDGFMDLINSYSLEERLITRYNQGLITAEEMEAAGIAV